MSNDVFAIHGPEKLSAFIFAIIVMLLIVQVVISLVIFIIGIIERVRSKNNPEKLTRSKEGIKKATIIFSMAFIDWLLIYVVNNLYRISL